MRSTTPDPVWTDEPTPDVWWGADGIEALIWADPMPYEPPSGKPSNDTASLAVQEVPQ